MAPILNDIELALLGQLQLDPAATAADLARRLKKRPHVVQHALHTLRRKSLIRRVPIVDLAHIGFLEFVFLLTVPSAARADIRKRLAATRPIRWYAELSGEIDFYVSIAVRTQADVAAVIDDLRRGRSGSSVSVDRMAVLLRHHFLERGYLNASRRPSKIVSVGGSDAPVVELDQLDRQIVMALRRAGQDSERELAAKLKIGQTTLSYRIRRLEERNVICGYYNRLSSSNVGMQHVKLLLLVSGAAREFRDSLIEWSCAHRHVTLIRELFGGWDFELSVEVKIPADAIEIREELLERFPKSFHEIRILGTLREYYSGELPL